MVQAGSDVLPTRIGRYEIRREIGSGGVGIVYAAHDPALARDVAVKLLRTDRCELEDLGASHERLRAEAKAMAKLAHPNVVTVFDVGAHEGAVYLAMELVEGASMRDWMRSTARPWREVLAMYFQAGLGLSAAHSAGIVHRDFKPANVLVGVDRRARVTDFGLASAGPARVDPPRGDADLLQTDAGGRGGGPRIDAASLTATGTMSISPRSLETTESLRTTRVERPVGRGVDVTTTAARLDVTLESIAGAAVTRDTDLLTRTGFVAGTPAYLAPELFLGGRADERSDQFAFAVSLYEGLYGERPFAGDDAQALEVEVVAGRVRTAPSRTRVPLWVREIVLRGLAGDPAQRHPSVRSMLAAFSFLARVMWD